MSVEFSKSKSNLFQQDLHTARSRLISESCSAVQAFANDKCLDIINSYLDPTETGQKLKSIRVRLMGELVAQAPIKSGEAILEIIDEYVGPDEVQEESIGPSLPQLLEQLKDEDIMKGYYETHDVAPAEKSMYEAFSRTFMDSFAKEIDRLPLLFRVETHMLAEERAKAGLALFQALTSTLRAHADKISKEDAEELSSGVRAAILSEFQSSIQQQYGEKTLIVSQDRSEMVNWVRNIVATQKKMADLLPPISLQKGDSQGITFGIYKNGTLCGYLYGTMHNVPYSIENGEKLAELSEDVQKRLYECSFLATEEVDKQKRKDPSPVEHDPYDLEAYAMRTHSVEEGLYKYAVPRGIPIIGIDTDARGEFLAEIIRNEFEKTRISNKIKDPLLDLSVAMQLKGQLSGDMDILKYVMLTQESMNPPTAKEIELNNLRNAEMTENIDVLLKACLAQEGSTKPKAFCAVGHAHLISSKYQPNSIVERLKKKGYSIQPELVLTRVKNSSQKKTDQK